MTLLRGHLLTTAPFAMVALCYAIAAPPSSTPRFRDYLPSRADLTDAALVTSCQSVAENLEETLPAGWGIVIHEPFVISGDCQIKELESYYHQTIAPTVRALSIQYFDQSPTWPVTVIVCSCEDSYQKCNHHLDKRSRNDYSGVYSRREHRVVVNISTGDGTLAHELTHALAHADFPQMPEWLDEGLASLYEECEFSDDGFRLIGQENWRGSILRGATQRGDLRSIPSLASEQFASSDRASIDYAQARYLCLFLERHQLLAPFYRKCRQRHDADPDGTLTLAELFESKDLKQLDKQFQDWIRTLKPGSISSGD